MHEFARVVYAKCRIDSDGIELASCALVLVIRLLVSTRGMQVRTFRSKRGGSGKLRQTTDFVFDRGIRVTSEI